MSLACSFYFDTPVGPSEIRACLAATGLFVPGHGRDAERLFAPGVCVSVMPERFRNDYLRATSIDAHLNVYFANSDKTNTGGWTRNTVNAVTALLDAYPGDALLMYCSDSPALMRKAGRLTLDPRAGLWMPEIEPEVLSLMKQPYRFERIPIDRST